MTEIKSIDEILPKNVLEGTARKLSEYYDRDLIIYNCREVKGMNGIYMRFVVSETEEGEQFYLATGAIQPFEILKYLDDNKLFPVRAKFVESGRSVLMKPI